MFKLRMQEIQLILPARQWGNPIQVTTAQTKTTIVSHSPSPSALAEPVVVSFTVESSLTSVVKPDGPAIVTADTGEICNAAVTNGVGSCTLSFATEGRRNLLVRYLGNGDFAPSNSAEVSHNVKRATFTRILTAVPNPSVVDQIVVFQFSVVSVSGGGDQPTGTVTVVADTGETCTGSLSSGTGTCTTDFSAFGTKTVLATYNGNTDFKTSTSVPFYQSVTKASTITEITSDLSAATQVGESVSVAFRVTSNIAAKPTGSVTVSIVGSTDSRETCTVGLSGGTGSCTITPIKAGSARAVQAVYAGTADRFASSTSPSVNHPVDKASTTIVILSDDPDSSVVGQQVTFEVRVRASTLDSLRPGGSYAIRLADDTDLCGGVLNASSEGSCTYTFTSQGFRSIKAVYLGAADYVGSTSGDETHNVDKANTTTTVSVSPSPSKLNQQVTVNVAVSAAGTGGGTPTGRVNVTAVKGGATKSCTITEISSATKSCKLTLDDVGDWTVTATYPGDSNFNGSSKNIDQTVQRVASATTVVVTPSPSVKGQSVKVEVTVAKTGEGSGTLGGSVAVTASRTDSLITKTCNITNISSGSGICYLTLDVVTEWTVEAVYAGNDDFLGSSDSTSHTVNEIPTTTTVESIAPSSSVTGQSVTVSVKVARSGVGSGTPDGNVIVTATRAGGGTASCPADITLDSGSGNCSLTLPTAGTWSIKAAYQGTTDFDPSYGTKDQTVDPSGTATTVDLDPNSSVTGQSVTVDVTVAPTGSGGGIPAGTVSVTATKSGGGSVSCPSAIVLNNGSGSCTLALTAAGDWTVSAVYSENTNYNTSTGTDNITVGKATTNLSISGHTPSPSTSGSVVTVSFNLAVTSPGSGTPTGLVTVKATTKVSGTDYEETCTATGSVGECDLVLSPAGTWKLSATYPGDDNFNSKTSADVDHTVQ